MASEATELIRMARSLLNLPMSHMTISHNSKQDTIHMSDGSEIVYRIDITLQTEDEHSIAGRKIQDLNNRTVTEPIERIVVGLLNDCPDGAEEPADIAELLTADDYPECAE